MKQTEPLVLTAMSRRKVSGLPSAPISFLRLIETRVQSTRSPSAKRSLAPRSLPCAGLFATSPSNWTVGFRGVFPLLTGASPDATDELKANT
jgi:hypothetical protein